MFGKHLGNVSEYVNGVTKITGKEFEIFSTNQPADNIKVIIPSNVRMQSIDFDEEIELVNPIISVSTETRGSYTVVNYVLKADDIVKVEK